MNWETVIGLEIHAQLATASKIFSGAATRYGAAPNTQASLVDLGYPGRAAGAQRRSRAHGDEVRPRDGLHDRAPLGVRAQELLLSRPAEGLPDQPVRAADRAHAAASRSSSRTAATKAHRASRARTSRRTRASRCTRTSPGMSGIDLNRAGTPLLEIVSEPDMRSAKEAVAYMSKIHALVRYLEICDGNMQEGSFRCDANVSVRRQGETKLGTRAELKNLNSFRFVEKAIEFEVERQIELLESGGKVVQETRLYDPDRDETRPMRSKEEANDYRYFPDPDLLADRDRRRRDRRACARRCRSCRTRSASASARNTVCPAYDAGVLTAQRAARRLLRGSRGRDARGAEARRELGDGRAHGGAQPRRARDRRVAASRRRRSRRCSTGSPTARSPARSRRKCSRRCGKAKARSPRSSTSAGSCRSRTPRASTRSSSR